MTVSDTTHSTLPFFLERHQQPAKTGYISQPNWFYQPDKTDSIDLPKLVLSADQNRFYQPAKTGSINLQKLVLST
jgi:hypothetical protein